MNLLQIGILSSLLLGISIAYTVLDHSKIVACYWGTWAFYRTGNGKFDISNIDASLCTHGFYGFAMLTEEWKVGSFDPWFDLAPSDIDVNSSCTFSCNYDRYRQFTSLKKTYPKFKAMLSIGGWNAGSKIYSEMAADPIKRKLFINSLIPFIKKFGFDGIDLDWEYPGARDGNLTLDKDQYTKLIQEMGHVLSAEGYLLSAALSPNPEVAENGYDMPSIIKHFDFVNIMCYDYHGFWPLKDDDFHNFTGHNSPLFGRPEESDFGFENFTAYATINYYLNSGVPKEKIVMGMPTYGRGFMLSDVSKENNGLYCPASDGNQEGPYTRQNGIWGYNEILEFFFDSSSLSYAQNNQWKIIVDSCYQAPFAFNGPNWIGYDDEKSIKQKVRFINFYDLAGAMIWSLETDDFLGLHSDKKYPLIRAINEIFAIGEKYDPSHDLKCGTAPICDMLIPELTTEEPMTVQPDPTTTTTSLKPTLDPETHPFGCSENNEKVPFPGDCHKYLRCVVMTDGSYTTEIYNCGNYVFDPNTHSCVDPNLPGNENLCDETIGLKNK